MEWFFIVITEFIALEGIVMKKETVGKKAIELQGLIQEELNPLEIQAGMQEEYMQNLIQQAELGSKIYPRDFFIIVITKNEKLLTNVFRNYFFHRSSCPTPDYDQTVFRCNRESTSIDYLWTIPSRDACFHLKEHALEVHADEKHLLKFVLEFADGTLFKLCKKLNNEEPDSPLLQGNA